MIMVTTVEITISQFVVTSDSTMHQLLQDSLTLATPTTPTIWTLM
jgi:hypothetical protein